MISKGYTDSSYSGVIHGSVYDKQNGAPYSAVLINIDKEESATYTNLDGSFYIGQIPGGEHTLYIHSSALGTRSIPVTVKAGIETSLKITVTSTGELESSVSESTLPYGKITGIVRLASSGEPVSGAKINLNGLEKSTETNTSGEYFFNNLIAGTYTLTALFDKYPQSIIKGVVVVSGDTQKIDIAVGIKKGHPSSLQSKESGIIKGKVNDRNTGEALAGGVITIRELKQSTNISRKGTFRFDSLPGGSYTFIISVTGYKETVIQGIPSLDSQVTSVKILLDASGDLKKSLAITPWQPGSLIVAVNDETTSLAVKGASVQFTNEQIREKTDQTGIVSFPDLSTGDHSIIISADGYKPDTTGTFTIDEGDTLKIKTSLVPVDKAEKSGKIVAINATNPEGAALQGARITELDSRKSGLTDVSGKFSFRIQQSFRLWIKATHPDYKTILLPLDPSESDSINLSFSMIKGDSCSLVFVHQGKKAQIKGIVKDEKSGKPLAGVRITPDGLDGSAISGTNGEFTIIDIPAGSHSFIAIHDGYAQYSVPSTTISASDTFRLNINMKVESITDLFRMTVSGSAVKNTEAGLLKERRQTMAVTDAIGGIEMSRSGSGNAADAMKKVTGATVTDGKYVYVRGLGERYNITLLDGSEIPSTDPDRRTVPMDIFPSTLIENITTIKTFTPDLPGSFTGGCINIQTKEPPEKPTLAISASGSYNSETTWKNDFLSYKGGKTDWLGFDDGTRAIPARLSDTSVHIPSGTMLPTDESHRNARLLDTFTNLFTPIMTPKKNTALPNQNYSMNFGGRTSIFTVPAGFLGSIAYSHKDGMYTNGEKTIYDIHNNISVDSVGIDKKNIENKSSRNVLWGALSRCLLELPEGLVENLKLNFQADYMYVRKAEDVCQEREGWGSKAAGQGNVYIISNSLDYVEQGISSLALKTHFFLGMFNRLEGDIRYGYINSKQNEPDARFFTCSYGFVNDSVKQWGIKSTIYDKPTRYFRTLNEDNKTLNFDLKIPVDIPWGDSANVKSGFFFSSKYRTFGEHRFTYNQGFNFTSDPRTLLFTDSTLGILDTSKKRWTMGNYIVDGFELKGNYHGDQSITGMYALTELPVSDYIKLITGLRYEHFDMYSASEDTTITKSVDNKKVPAWNAHLINEDFFPSLATTFEFTKQTDLRFSFSRTGLRPSMREITPYSSYDFENDWTLYGNIDLKSTICRNIDLRWEWFRRPGEIFSIGAYYKNFKNPIILLKDPIQNDLARPVNSPYGYALGMEFEARSSLDFLNSVLKNFRMGFNAALISSKMKITDVEQGQWNSMVDKTGYSDMIDFFGQSPWVINANLSYDNDISGTSVAAYFNMAGPYITLILMPPKPPVLQAPFPQLDLIASQKFMKRFTLKTSLSNIFNSTTEQYQEFKGKRFLYQEYSKGLTVSAGLSMTL